MNKYIASILLLFLVTVLFVAIYDEITGNVVIETKPCQAIKCRASLFGFLTLEAEQVGVTQDGYAICNCPNEPPWVLYFIQTYREY